MMMAATCMLAAGIVRAGENADDLRKQLTEAATEVSYLSFDRGSPLFAGVAAKAAEGSELWQAAIYGEAVCLHQQAPATPQNLAEASRLYTLLVTRCPAGKFTPRAMIALGTIAEQVDYLGDKTDLETARNWYSKAKVASGEGSELGHEATLRLASTYIQTFEAAQIRRGLQMLEEHLAKYPDNPLASAMWQYAGNTWLYPLGDEKRAIDCYLKADARGLLEVGREGPVYWRIANLAERNGMREVAMTYYTRIIQKTPTSGKAYESQLALRRLGAPVPPIQLFQRQERPAEAGAK
jgi:tetratricopeptide (TPR) repeat protein